MFFHIDRFLVLDTYGLIDLGQTKTIDTFLFLLQYNLMSSAFLMVSELLYVTSRYSF